MLAVDEVSPYSYFFCRWGDSLPAGSVLIRMRRGLTFLVILVVAAFVTVFGAAPAAAHGNHSHEIAPGSSPSSAISQAAENGQLAEISSAEANMLPGPSDRHGKSECCCGSVMCHAGVTLTFNLLSLERPSGARVLAEPSSGRPQHAATGLERPPRTSDAA